MLRRLEVGGAELIAFEVAAASRRHQLEAYVTGEPGPLLRQLPAGVHYLPRRPAPFPVLVGQVIRQAIRVRADVLHAHQRREALACVIAANVLRRQAVEHAHTVIPSRSRKLLSFRSARIFAVSEAVREMVVNDFGRPASHVRLVENVPVAVAEAVIPRREVDESHLQLVGVGRVDEQKDPMRFIRVVSEIATQVSVSARWLGDGPLLSPARAAAAAADVHCRFPGHSDQITEELLAADALVITSAWEGLPLVALEALALGVPVVATAVGGLRELLEDAGAGVVVGPDCPDARFARTIIEAVSPGVEKSDRVARGRELIAQRFTPEIAFGPLWQAYSELLTKRSAPG